MEQIVQIAGALLILTAFAAVQTGKWEPRALPALICNFVGAAVLTVTALLDQDWGFVLLESVWAAVSLAGLLARFRRKT